MKKISFLLVLLLGLSCNKEKLSPESVVEANIIQRNQSELDTYIRNEFVIPFGIDVNYRWNASSAPLNSYAYPAQPEKVRQVLEAIKYMWLDTYLLPSVGGSNFMKGKAPIRIHLYGGKNLDRNGSELIHNTNETPIEMHLYDVNNFDPKDAVKVFILMRTVHHQFAKRLLELYPYNRDAFSTISRLRYVSELPKKQNLSMILPNAEACNQDRSDPRFYVDRYLAESATEYEKVRKSYFSVGSRIRISYTVDRQCGLRKGNVTSLETDGMGANENSFFTTHSYLSAEDDFAEIISTMLTHTATEIDMALTNAKTPNGTDAISIANAEKAHSEMLQKKAIVEDYFKKEIGISLTRMQVFSIQRMKAYLNK